MKKILLHACCGPCAEFPLQELINSGYDVTLYFFNPNIHPPAEWSRRLEQLRILAEKRSVPLIVEGRSEPEKWTAWIAKPQSERCRMCYSLRLERTAAKAAEIGFDRFASTLQVSIYQDFEKICSIGHAAAQKYKIQFEDADFRPGFRTGQDMARQDELYRQKYCGCSISLNESKFKEKILRDLSTYG